MIPDTASVNRLGFEAWADNVIANVIEDMSGQPFEASIEELDLTVLVRLQNGQVNATVRAYVEGQGWIYHDRTIKLP